MPAAPSSDIHPLGSRALPRRARELLLDQRGQVVWLYGLSGSGKSTLALGLESRLHRRGVLTQLLDGDDLRSGLNSDLGFGDADRQENIRRTAEVARLHARAGIVAIVSCITPRREMRRMARRIVGEDDFLEVHVRCSLETCRRRDVKGLYAKADRGELPRFTGRDSAFEPPEEGALGVDTDTDAPEASLDRLLEAVLPRIGPSSPRAHGNGRT